MSDSASPASSLDFSQLHQMQDEAAKTPTPMKPVPHERVIDISPTAFSSGPDDSPNMPSVTAVASDGSDVNFSVSEDGTITVYPVPNSVLSQSHTIKKADDSVSKQIVDKYVEFVEVADDHLIEDDKKVGLFDEQHAENRRKKLLIIAFCIIALFGGVAILGFIFKDKLAETNFYKSIRKKLRTLPTPFSYSRSEKGLVKFVPLNGGPVGIPTDEIWRLLKSEDFIFKEGSTGQRGEKFTPKRLVAHESIHFEDLMGVEFVVSEITETNVGFVLNCVSVNRETQFLVATDELERTYHFN